MYGTSYELVHSFTTPPLPTPEKVPLVHVIHIHTKGRGRGIYPPSVHDTNFDQL